MRPHAVPSRLIIPRTRCFSIGTRGSWSLDFGCPPPTSPFSLPFALQSLTLLPAMLSAKSVSGAVLARQALNTATIGGGGGPATSLGGNVTEVDSDGLQGRGGGAGTIEGETATTTAAVAASEGDKSGFRPSGPCPRPSSVGSGGGTTMPTRFGRHGKPLLLPKPTLAAHNGRMLMEYEWAHAGFY